MNKKINKPYLMLGGTFAPAFLLVAVNIAIQKRATVKPVDFLIFTGALMFSGFITAQMLKDY